MVLQVWFGLLLAVALNADVITGISTAIIINTSAEAYFVYLLHRG